MKLNSETIVAIATPPGRGGVGIIRVSGSKAGAVAAKLLGFIPEPRYAKFCSFKSPTEVLDEGIALFFPAPHSFTGEDVLELQGHGGPVVLDRILKEIIHNQVRLARPGEFSQRAFLNNKIDLAEAEAIADLINASSEQAAQSAMRSLQGEFSKKIKQLLTMLIDLRKLVEAAIDFPEEEIDFITETDVVGHLNCLIDQLTAVRTTARQGTLLQEGMTVVIAGEPNAGKSSLLNCLSGKESAIVTEIAGTTRDILREYIHIDGMPLHIIDTAGLRETADIVELEGVRRARLAIQNADLVLLVVDASRSKNLDEEIERVQRAIQLPSTLPILVTVNKIDLIDETPGLQQRDNRVILKISAKQQLGVLELQEYLKKYMGFEETLEGVFIARRRHLDALTRAFEFLKNGLQQLEQHHAGELLAEDLRQAQLAISEITGEFSSDDLLGEIFSNFCIGK